MEFQIVQSKSEFTQKGFYLIPDNWDDWFEYEISYALWIKGDTESCVGRVKIAKKNQSTRKTDLPTRFHKLDEEYISIGFSDDYYEMLNSVSNKEYREEILEALNDIAFDLKKYEEVKTDNVTRISLMREYTEKNLKGQINRMALGGARLTDYDFQYILPFINPLTDEMVKMSFKVKRNVKPSSNIHVLIGKNGIGKTTVLKNMIYALEKNGKVENIGEIKNGWRENFSNIVFVSFSAFDMPILEDSFAHEDAIPYKFIGLLKKGSIKNRDTLTKEFVDCSFNFYQNTSKMRLWQDTIKILESDNTFLEQEIGGWVNNSVKKTWISEINLLAKSEKKLDSEEKRNILKERHYERVYDKFATLSSGHKIILLTLVNLIDLVEEKTVVLLDEPEEHLHPPLVAAFIQALSNLLIYRNGVGIIATHSPVIVQEVPRKCVWILERYENCIIPRRPEIETYGENLGELTSEIFGYEVINSGFHKELKYAIEISETYEEAKEVFDNQLGKEAKSILQAYMYDKGIEE